MRKSLFFAILISCAFSYLYSQNLQLGLSINANQTYFNKAKSSYDNQFSSTNPINLFGISVPVYIDLTKVWSLKTGLGIQLKRYRFSQEKFDFPNFEGSSYTGETFNSIEIPLLFCYRSESKRKYKIEYTTGVILTINSPTDNTVGWRINKTDTTYIKFTQQTSKPKWEKTFSPDVYIGINLIKYSGEFRRHQLTLSYQYGLMHTEKLAITTTLSNPTLTKEYKAQIRPTLSCISLAYTYFPKKFHFRIGKKSK